MHNSTESDKKVIKSLIDCILPLLKDSEPRKPKSLAMRYSYSICKLAAWSTRNRELETPIDLLFSKLNEREEANAPIESEDFDVALRLIDRGYGLSLDSYKTAAAYGEMRIMETLEYSHHGEEQVKECLDVAIDNDQQHVVTFLKEVLSLDDEE